MHSSLVVKPLTSASLQTKSEKIFTCLLREALPPLTRGAARTGLDNAVGILVSENWEGYRSRIVRGIRGGADLMMTLDYVGRSGLWTERVAATLCKVLERGQRIKGFMSRQIPSDQPGDWANFCFAEDNFVTVDSNEAARYLEEARDSIRSLVTRHKLSANQRLEREVVDELRLIRCESLFSTMAPNLGQFHNSAAAWANFNRILAHPETARVGSIEREDHGTLAALCMQLGQLALAMKTSNR